MAFSYNCYKYNREWFLVEMIIDAKPSEIEFEKIVVPNENVRESDWQCPYMEQYLNSDGTEKLCEAYDVPEEDSSPCRISFFIYNENPKKLFAFGKKKSVLRTPYGEFELSDKEKIPERLRKIIEFDECD
ncbi:MAG: hypothetical protein E7479_08995 [Ruminococcaceae bacterium]|nr:hypothetical protein [Oscillospiraceae bacterium]